MVVEACGLCHCRRKDVNLFLSGLLKEGIVNTLHILLFYLQSSPKEHRPLVAVLLLHLDLLVRSYSSQRVFIIIIIFSPKFNLCSLQFLSYFHVNCFDSDLKTLAKLI